MSHHSNTDPATSRRLGRIEKALTNLIEKVEQMAVNLQELHREIAEIGAAVAALAERLRNSPDQAEIDAVVTELDTIGKQVEGLAPAGATPTV